MISRLSDEVLNLCEQHRPGAIAAVEPIGIRIENGYMVDVESEAWQEWIEKFALKPSSQVSQTQRARCGTCSRSSRRDAKK